MLLYFPLVPFLALATSAGADRPSPPVRPVREQIEANIGPKGARTSTQSYAGIILPGVVIAAPYPEDTYGYTWTRDAALTVHYLVQLLERDPTSKYAHQMIIEDYRTLQTILMDLDTIDPFSSGMATFKSGLNLGEPKFNLDGTAFMEGWGRPQGDGPASRAITLMRYSQWAVDNGMKDYIRHYHWPLIRNDLDFIAQYWTTRMHDVWEEINEYSFYTRMVQYKALLFGLNTAADLGVSPDNPHVKNWAAIAPYIKCSLSEFWQHQYKHIVANIPGIDGRTGMDMDTVLAATHTFDPALGCDSWIFQPCSDTALRNFKRVEDEYRYQIGWKINQGIPDNKPVHLGRYKEDVYQGGHPWYLLTLGASEFLYDVAISWEYNGWVDITEISLPFFQHHVSSDMPVGRYFRGQTGEYEFIVDTIRNYAYEYIMLANSMIPEDGSMNEQYHNATGQPWSVRHLTWSYTAYGSARDRFSGTLDRSWFTGDAAMANFQIILEPGLCQNKNTVKGDYNWDNPEFGFQPLVPHGKQGIPHPGGAAFKERVANTDSNKTPSSGGGSNATTTHVVAPKYDGDAAAAAAISPTPIISVEYITSCTVLTTTHTYTPPPPTATGVPPIVGESDAVRVGAFAISATTIAALLGTSFLVALCM